MQINSEKYFSYFLNFTNVFTQILKHNFENISIKFMFYWLKIKLFTPVLDYLKQGISPQKLAWSVAVGLVVGISPIIGTTTLLCLGLALVLRLNLAVIQLANYVAYPLQILLLIPFFQVGSLILGEKGVSFSVDLIIHSFESDFLLALQEFGWAILHAVLVWMAVAVPLAIGIYTVCFSIFNKFLKEKSEVI